MDAVRESHRTETGAVLRSLPFAAFGLSFWWAWVWLAFFSPVLFGQVGLANRAYMISVVAVAVSCIAIALLSRTVNAIRSNGFIIVLAICFSIGTFLLIAWVDVPSSWVFIVGSIFTGAGSGSLIVAWGRYFAKLVPSTSLICIVASFLIAAVLYFAFNGMPSHLSVSILALMPVLSAACIVWLLRANANDKDEAADDDTSLADISQVSSDRSNKLPSWRVMTGIAIFAFSSGFLVSLATFSDAAPFSLVGSIQVLANAAVALVVLIVITLRSFKLELRKSCRIALPIIAVGLLLLSVLDGTYALFGLAVAFLGSAIFELAVWSTFARVSYEQQIDPIMLFGIGHGVKLIGWALGSLTVTLTAPLLTQSQSGLFVVVLLVFAATFFLQEKTLPSGSMETSAANQVPSETDADAAQDMQDRLAELAAEYALTPRETEVCELLAKGRTIPYIEEQLSISHSTAVTHTRHIYEKLSIHDRQELIDLVE